MRICITFSVARCFTYDRARLIRVRIWNALAIRPIASHLPQDVFYGHMRDGPADPSCDSPERQTVTAQSDDFVDDCLLLRDLDERAVSTNRPTEWRRSPKKASALFLIGLGTEHPFPDAVTLSL